MRKLLYNLFVIVLIITSVLSCSEDNENLNRELEYKKSTLSSGKAYFISNISSARNGVQERHSLELEFESNVVLPSNEVDLQNFLQENAQYIDGVFKLYIDDEIVYEIFVENGVEVSSRVDGSGSDTGNPGDYPCTFNGLSHCTQDSIGELSFFGKALCITAGFTCVAQQFADCAWIHCGGEEWAQDNGIN